MGEVLSDAAMAVVALVMPGIPPGERLVRLTERAPARPMVSAGTWLLEIASDQEGAWRSPWLRACAIRAIRIGMGDGRPEIAPVAIEHPVVGEELDLLTASRSEVGVVEEPATVDEDEVPGTDERPG